MSPSQTIRVLLVEDHVLVRQGTKAVIEGDPSIKVVGEADSAPDAIRLVDELGPDVVLLDVRLRGGTGIEVARALQRKRSPAKVLVVTAYDHEQYVSALARAGVSGYVLKDTPGAELVKAIHEVHEGRAVLGGDIAATLLRTLSRGQKAEAEPAPTDLTFREIEVLEMVQHGLNTPDIARRMGISKRTVDTFVARISEKLGASSRQEAVDLAIKRGLIKPVRP